MTRRELNLAIARKTGEKLSIVRTRGFSILKPDSSARAIVNLDQFTSGRTGLFPDRQHR